MKSLFHRKLHRKFPSASYELSYEPSYEIVILPMKLHRKIAPPGFRTLLHNNKVS